MKMIRAVQLLFAFGVLSVVTGDTGDNEVRQGKLNFVDGATSLMRSLATDLISRSGGSSQVLSLNLTNLFILLVLKAIIFGVGTFGYGNHGYGRTLDSFPINNSEKSSFLDKIVSESEALMMLSYLRAEATKDYGCLQRLACEDPRKAGEYALTGKFFLKGSELLSKSLNYSKYENALNHIEEAMNYGMRGQDCFKKYHCDVN